MLAFTFLTDFKGLRLARFAIASALLSQKGEFDIHLHTDGFILQADDPIQRLAHTLGRKLEGHQVSSEPFAGHTTAAHISLTQFLKFAAIEKLIEQYDRVIYADTDLLFFRPVPFATIDTGGRPLVAVHDVAEISGITNNTFRQRCLERNLPIEYFNSGMMLFDCAALNLPKLRENYGRLIMEHQLECPYKVGCRTNDQCVWNLMFQRNWEPAPLSWNVQGSMRFTQPWAEADIRHYTGPKKVLPLKPWRSDSREAQLVFRIAKLLDDPETVPFNPIDIFYRLNGLRWRRASSLLSAAYSATEANHYAKQSHGSTKIVGALDHEVIDPNHRIN